MPDYSYEKDYPFAAYITNLGKYNEGELVGEWVKFPTTYDELQKVFERIGIGTTDDFGQPYEEWFITDYDCYVGGLYDKLGEYESLDELNYLASKLDEMSQGEYEQFRAAMEVGGHSDSLQEIINLTENLDCYDIYPDIEDHDDLGRYYIDELDAMQVPDHLRNYIDYEAYGRDVALEEGGDFTEFGYVRDTGSSFHEYYDGNRENIPEEYRVMSRPDNGELTQDDKLDMATDLAFDLDEFFRQRDIQYAAEHPDAHSSKEQIADMLLDGKTRALKERLAELAQGPDDALSSRIAEYEAATGYEEYLDIDTAAIREALENPDKSHIDEMLAFAEKAEQEYAAEAAAFVQTPESILEQARAVYGDRMHPNDADRAEAVSIAAACDDVFREYTFDYNHFFPKEDEQRQALVDTILQGDTAKIKTGLINMGRAEGVTEEVAPLIARLDAFEKECGINTYMVYQLKEGPELRDFRFESLDSLQRQGLSVKPENYELIYAARFTPSETLETVYADLNIRRPDDFHGHSLSVSDIVVLREDGRDAAHYCDSMGFAEVPQFLEPMPEPDSCLTGDTIRTPRGSFHLTDMTREQMEAAGYGFHHASEDGRYQIMANGTRAFAIQTDQEPVRFEPEKMTVVMVEPMKEPYVKEISSDLRTLQAEVGGDIAAVYPFQDPVALVCNDEGKLIGLDLNRSLRNEQGEVYDIVVGSFLIVGLGAEDFTSLSPEFIQKYTEQFKRPELFAKIDGQIVSIPIEPDNPLRTAEMTLEDDYGMIDGIINNGRRGEELEKAKEAAKTIPDKKPSIIERLEEAKRECAGRKSPGQAAPQKKPPELGEL